LRAISKQLNPQEITAVIRPIKLKKGKYRPSLTLTRLFLGDLEKLYYFHVNGSICIVQKIDFEIKPEMG